MGTPQYPEVPSDLDFLPEAGSQVRFPVVDPSDEPFFIDSNGNRSTHIVVASISRYGQNEDGIPNISIRMVPADKAHELDGQIDGTDQYELSSDPLIALKRAYLSYRKENPSSMVSFEAIVATTCFLSNLLD